MNRVANSDSIPIDLIPEILSRLPSKSIARFRCVLKQWASILCQPYFTELFFTRSSARPRLLIGVIRGGEWSFFSSLQPQNQDEKSSLVVAADFHTKFFEDRSLYYCSNASGLIYFPYKRISKEYDVDDEARVICNPRTGQYAILPPDLRTTYRYCDGFLGFDPIGQQFKVLVFNKRVDDELVYQILTLETENVRWREIKYPLTYGRPSWGFGEGICINGVLYWIAHDEKDVVIGCFDVRSEKFKFLYPDVKYRFRKLINYKGKLGRINWESANDGGFPIELRMWVLEDVEKGERSKYAYTLRVEDKVVEVNNNLSVVGVTASGEIVLAKKKDVNRFMFSTSIPKRTLS